MQKCVLLAAALAASSPVLLLAQSPPQPQAQTQTQKPTPPYPAPAKWFAALHGGAQVGSTDLSRSTDFPLNEETATFQTDQSANGGGLLDISGAARLYQNYGVGVSFALFESTNDSTFSGSLPHPIVFDQPRAFNGSASLDHKERAVHIQALWFIPFTDKVDFTVGIGPSFFTVEQGFVRGVQYSENPPDFTTVTIDTVDTANIKESGVGFNLGGTMTYAITRRIGASVMMRYAWGSLTFKLNDTESVEGNAGGFQIGAGIGVRF